ncbi:LLM class F420-dependent oxidoreductase [Mycolicibacterium confluentis]|uniref:LLM class F420-dependent oxidoreductase n=1 Tax=Mycolicibacterium confluentis TaxID=28047 RepID=A0A7I7XZC1_9MYCO|nr:LLM class F420-dependent oxidoreductase [Mycolicibacterium confluentis]MCV7319613.1 LLM class F420-dependent oxidoreductase [Mycolicibacterium confluentis]ORV34220.1 LLM class F420-dependent oxidoreductase [Mycolicibacterium confluentis]BBZ34636.1 LLM class F420-dependent oxidoreductase [Mycolicibacterium confluentis]
MEIGLHALGIDSGAERTVIDAVAGAAERAGFSTLWAGEHVAMVDESASRYPYSQDGQMAVPPTADWLDPLIALSFAAAATTRIELATGVLLLAEHNPVIVAKQAASLDRLCGGRFTLGVGIGWSRDEFDALGVPFEGRAQRTQEYVAAMRTLWRDEPASFHGEFVNFDGIRVNPKPRRGRVPVVLGGNSDAALRRVVEWGDGWYGYSLADLEEVAERVSLLRGLCREAHRDAGDLRLSVSLRHPSPNDVGRLADIGVDELVLVGSPPADPLEAEAWVGDLARQWMWVLH